MTRGDRPTPGGPSQYPGPQPQPGMPPQPYYGAPAPPPGYPPQGGYGYQLPPGYEIKRKKRFYKRVWFWLLVAVIVVIIIIVAAVSSAVNKATNNPHTVIYQVTGNGKTADVTYLNINGDGTSGEQQNSNAKLPFSTTVHGKGDFSEYTLTAQLQSGSSISCTITVDGKVKAQQTSTGQYAVVSCTASGGS